MRILKKLKVRSFCGEWTAGIVAVLLVICFQVYIVHILFEGEKRFLKGEFKQQIFWTVSQWNGLESMMPDGKERGHAFDGRKYELYIYTEEKIHTIKIDTSENLSEMYAMIAYDLNLRNPLTLSCLDSLMKSRLGTDFRDMPFVFRRVDSLGNTKEVYPRENTKYMDMEEVGYVRLGYISGEKVRVHFDYSWKVFFRKFWWQVLGVAIVGSVVIVLVFVFVTQVRKHKRMRLLQQMVLQQRMHDLKNPISAVECILYNAHDKCPEGFKGKNGEDFYELGADRLEMLKQETSNILRMTAMMYCKRVEWKEVNLREELEKLIVEIRLAYKGKKEVFVRLDYRLPECLLLSEQFLYALRNLLDNAVKYSGDVAEVTISCREEGKGIAVSVADRGKGIAIKDLPYIFEEYWRVGKDKKTKGYGLGLASVKKIVKRHKGKIFVESRLGEGSVFTIKLHGYGKENKAFVCGGRRYCPDYLRGDVVEAGI